jgi:hypothetical protein
MHTLADNDDKPAMCRVLGFSMQEANTGGQNTGTASVYERVWGNPCGSFLSATLGFQVRRILMFCGDHQVMRE